MKEAEAQKNIEWSVLSVVLSFAIQWWCPHTDGQRKTKWQKIWNNIVYSMYALQICQARAKSRATNKKAQSRDSSSQFYIYSYSIFIFICLAFAEMAEKHAVAFRVHTIYFFFSFCWSAASKMQKYTGDEERGGGEGDVDKRNKQMPWYFGKFVFNFKFNSKKIPLLTLLKPLVVSASFGRPSAIESMLNIVLQIYR